MLLPASNIAREKAKKISCLNQQKQLGLILSMYAGSWNGYLPPKYSGTAWYNILIRNGLMKDMRSARNVNSPALVCPSEVRKHINGYTDFAANSWQFGGSNHKLEKVPNPSNCMLLIDAWDHYIVNQMDNYRKYIFPRHNYTTNLLYGDLHAGNSNLKSWEAFPTSKYDKFWGGK
jgi:hypothetical protein